MPLDEPSASLTTTEVRVLNADGTLIHEREPSPSVEHLLPIYEVMVAARRLDARLSDLHQRGRIGFHGGTAGEEAAAVGSAAALQPGDWVFPARHELGVALWRGVRMQRILDGAFAGASDGAKGRAMPGQGGFRSAKIVATSPLLGNHLIHAVGCAWAARGRREAVVAAAYFGATAVESGDFHTALNFAGVFRAPVLFLGRSHEAKGSLAAKGVAYGVEGVVCDGRDALAVLAAAGQARERALRGDGPTLIEVFLGGDADPIAHARRFLERQGAWGAEQQRALEARVEGELSAAADAAERAPAPPVASLFDDVYAQLPWHLAEQRASLPGR